ncbi:MAG: anti-sigma factor family protein [Acidimicrobiales bacterium]
MSCSEVQAMAPELGLGVLVGIERANALAHLDSCAPCRELVEEMANLGDSLLSLAPEAEPPAGFEARVLAGGQPTRSRKALSPWRRWPAVGLAAAVALAALGAGLGLSFVGSNGFQVGHPGVVAALGGRGISGAVLRDRGQEVGQVLVYSGQPSWVLMTVEADGPPTRVTCELETKRGSTLLLGSFTVSSGYRSWSSTLSIDPSQVVGVKLLNSERQTVATATL